MSKKHSKKGRPSKQELADLIVMAPVWCGEKDPEKLAASSTIWELKEIAEMLGIGDEEDGYLRDYE